MVSAPVLKVLALDPGGTTGVAIGLIDIERGYMQVGAFQAIFTHLQLYQQLRISSPDIVVCESFEYRNRSQDGLELISRELIGVVHLYIEQQGDRELYLQTAATVGAGGKSGYFSNKRLKDERLYEKAKPHAMDALRHLLHWYTYLEGFQYNKIGYGK